MILVIKTPVSVFKKDYKETEQKNNICIIVFVMKMN